MTLLVQYSLPIDLWTKSNGEKKNYHLHYNNIHCKHPICREITFFLMNFCTIKCKIVVNDLLLTKWPLLHVYIHTDTQRCLQVCEICFYLLNGLGQCQQLFAHQMVWFFFVYKKQHVNKNTFFMNILYEIDWDVRRRDFNTVLSFLLVWLMCERITMKTSLWLTLRLIQGDSRC